MTFNVTRSNARGILVRLAPGSYAVYCNHTGSYVYFGDGDQTRNWWNRNMRQYHGFRTPNGVNHRYLFGGY